MVSFPIDDRQSVLDASRANRKKNQNGVNLRSKSSLQHPCTPHLDIIPATAVLTTLRPRLDARKNLQHLTLEKEASQIALLEDREEPRKYSSTDDKRVEFQIRDRTMLSP